VISLRGAVLALVIAGPFSAIAWAAEPPSPPAANPVQVETRPVPLYLNRPKDRRAGQLIYRGGVEIDSDDDRVGGLSDLAVSNDGTRVIFVSDSSRWLRARLLYADDGDLTGMAYAEIAPMLDLDGHVMSGKEGDAEGIAAEIPGEPSGGVLVSFERDHRVWRYDLSQGLDARPTPVPIGSWAGELPNNSGIEAIALLPRNTLLAISENTLDDVGNIVGALEAYPTQVAHGGFGPVTLRANEPFAVTGAAADGDGGVYILERRFSFLGGLGMQIRRIKAGSIRPDTVLDGAVIASLSAGEASIDNMEGLAVRRGPDGKTYLYVISDDNFSALQRTVLLMFEVAQ
jgi:hypothetical protein